MPDIAILKEAAKRVSSWEMQYGIFANWQADSIGLVLVARAGGERVEKWVSWFEIEQSRYPTHTLERAEAAVLSGLSS